MLTNLWRYDIPRQSFKAFLLGLMVAIVCGLIITFFWRAPSSKVAEVAAVGRVEGRALGLLEGRRAAQSTGRRAALSDLDEIVATGTFDDGRDLAFDEAWNDAIEQAIDRAAHTPVLQLRRLDYWESLRK